MDHAADPIESFAGFLAQAERSPLTIKNYRGDLAAFAVWFEEINGEPMEPAKVTPTDLRQFKQWLVEQRKLKPSSVNRKLATLKSFLTWGRPNSRVTRGHLEPGEERNHPRYVHERSAR